MVTSCRITQGGFTYLGVLILVAVLSGFLGAAGTRWSAVDQREREYQLLRAGAEVREAIRSYYESSPGSVKQYPENLDTLLRDARFIGIRRHLRKIPSDPFTGKPDWVLLQAPTSGIMGIRSLSDKVPFKTANFATTDGDLANAGHYSDWQFAYSPPAVQPALK
jgi:type II secretory pathway pseudopilin PulG